MVVVVVVVVGGGGWGGGGSPCRILLVWTPQIDTATHPFFSFSLVCISTKTFTMDMIFQVDVISILIHKI